MSLYPSIVYENRNAHTDPDGTVTVTAYVYVAVFDENGLPANGNYLQVMVRPVNNPPLAEADIPVQVIGMRQLVFGGTISRALGNGQNVFTRDFTIDSYAAPTTILPQTCDARIDSVTINSKESAPGAADGQVTISAFSSYEPLMYSLNSGPYQLAKVFAGLAAGGYTANITDANGCSVAYRFNVPATRNLLISDPSVSIGGSNISLWNAAFNPVIFTYQRKDFEVTGVADSIATTNITGGTLIIVNGVTSAMKTGDLVYLNAAPYVGVYTALQAQSNGVVIDATYQNVTVSGFMNSNTVFSYYNITTLITYQDRLTGRTQTIRSVNRPNQQGIVKADLSSFLQSLLQIRDDSNYTAISFRDSNLSASYNIAYQENWTDPLLGDKQSDVITIDHPYFVTYTARQLGQKYGGNMAEFVPFKSVADPAFRAKWVTDFAEPAYSPGYPFDLGFVYSEYLMGLSPYFEYTLLDINRNPITGGVATGLLLSQDESYLLNEDSSRFIISNGTIVGSPVSLTPAQLGLNRLLINPQLVYQAAYINVVLKYDDDAGTHEVTQVQTLRIDGAVEDQSVYLRWIGLTGCWNYYRFVYNQEISLDVQNAVIIKNFVTDWENQQGIEEVISKSAGEKMKVMAEDLSVADIKGLQSIKYSPKVQMLINRNPVKWQTVVLNTATFMEYETQYGQYAFSVTFNLPGKNAQAQ